MCRVYTKDTLATIEYIQKATARLLRIAKTITNLTINLHTCEQTQTSDNIVLLKLNKKTVSKQLYMNDRGLGFMGLSRSQWTHGHILIMVHND